MARSAWLAGGLVLALLTLVFPRHVQAAAAENARLRGKVVDAATSAALPGVKITIQSDESIFGPRSVLADDEGDFDFPVLPQGTYLITVTSSSRPVRTLPVRLDAGETKDLTISVAEDQSASRPVFRLWGIYRDCTSEASEADAIEKLADELVGPAIRCLPPEDAAGCEASACNAHCSGSGSVPDLPLLGGFVESLPDDAVRARLWHYLPKTRWTTYLDVQTTRAKLHDDLAAAAIALLTAPHTVPPPPKSDIPTYCQPSETTSDEGELTLGLASVSSPTSVPGACKPFQPRACVRKKPPTKNTSSSAKAGYAVTGVFAGLGAVSLGLSIWLVTENGQLRLGSSSGCAIPVPGLADARTDQPCPAWTVPFYSAGFSLSAIFDAVALGVGISTRQRATR